MGLSTYIWLSGFDPASSCSAVKFPVAANPRSTLMRLGWSLIVLLGLLVLAPSAKSSPFEVPSVSGTLPSTSVRHWIKILVFGPQNRPIPIVWMSPQKFRVNELFEFLIVMPRRNYDAVASFSQKNRAQVICLSSKHTPSLSYAVQVSEHSPVFTSVCLLSQMSACRYFSDILRLPNVSWSSEERKPIDILRRSIKCEIG